MNKTAEFVIIGGGINGCSTAYHLAKRGVKNVLLIEKGQIASGPTGRSSGVVRQHYTIKTLAEMARDSVRLFQNFEEEIGGDAGFVQCGVVYFCGPENAETLKQNVEMLQGLGIRQTLLDAGELKRMEPQIFHENIACGGYEPDGGYADPALTANSFCEAAQRLGVEVLKRTQVTGLKIENEAILGVVTDKGEISSPNVINVAGPWGGQIAAMAGVEIPITPTRHPVVILQRPATWLNPTPVWADLINGWYFKPEGRSGIMVGSIQDDHHRVDIETYADVPSYEETDAYSQAILKRFPVMEEGLARKGWAGLYDVTPDSQPVIDLIAEVKGLSMAIGFSGHGFKIGPAVGRIMSELAIDGKCASYDITPFRRSRFSEGESSHGKFTYSIIG